MLHGGTEESFSYSYVPSDPYQIRYCTACLYEYECECITQVPRRWTSSAPQGKSQGTRTRAEGILQGTCRTSTLMSAWHLDREGRRAALSGGYEQPWRPMRLSTSASHPLTHLELQLSAVLSFRQTLALEVQPATIIARFSEWSDHRIRYEYRYLLQRISQLALRLAPFRPNLVAPGIVNRPESIKYLQVSKFPVRYHRRMRLILSRSSPSVSRCGPHCILHRATQIRLLLSLISFHQLASFCIACVHRCFQLTVWRYQQLIITFLSSTCIHASSLIID